MKRKILTQKNHFGVAVKQCCASCKMRKITSDGNRTCGLSGKKVASGHCCSRWTVSTRLHNAGMGGGQVKSWHYLSYYRERWTEQREALIAGRIQATQMLSAEYIRQEFEKEVGPVFINI